MKELVFTVSPILGFEVEFGGFGVKPHSGFTYNLGAANLQLVGNTLYIARQFAPLNGGVDVFEAQIQSSLQSQGYDIKFVDDWMYHIGHGEVHCGSTVKRSPVTDWWKKQPQP